MVDRLTEHEILALTAFADMCERGEIPPENFSMHTIGANKENIFHCGSTFCIAGGCDLLFGTNFANQNWLDKELKGLFLGQGRKENHFSTTSQTKAARAIHRRLAGKITEPWD